MTRYIRKYNRHLELIIKKKTDFIFNGFGAVIG